MGRRSRRDNSTASRTKSGFDFRPNAPPSRVTLIATFLASVFSQLATWSRVDCGSCTAAHTLTRSFFTSAKAQGGSIGAWPRNGVSYTASRVIPSSSNTRSTSPLSKRGRQGLPTRSCNCSLKAGVFAVSPGFDQVISSSLAICIAANVVSAIAATPPNG